MVAFPYSITSFEKIKTRGFHQLWKIRKDEKDPGWLRGVNPDLPADNSARVPCGSCRFGPADETGQDHDTFHIREEGNITDFEGENSGIRRFTAGGFMGLLPFNAFVQSILCRVRGVYRFCHSWDWDYFNISGAECKRKPYNFLNMSRKIPDIV